MKKLSINRPYIYKWKDKIRLAAVISFDEKEKELYYEVDEKYEGFLCTDNSDAFVFALVYFCMVNGYDIQCEVPMTEQLYYQLTTYFIPVVSSADELMQKVDIVADTVFYDEKPGKAVGASVSGGVDSFYTIVKHMDCREKDFRLTHLVLSNIFGAYGSEEETRKRYEQLIKKNGVIAKELNLDLLCIYTNIHEFNYKAYPNYYSLRTCSMILALKKLFGIYYYASAYMIEKFTINPELKDCAKYDLFNMQIMSDRALYLYTSGGEASRTEKTACIADNDIVKRHLYVCNIKIDNCSICDKCRRTLITLWGLDKLEEYRDVFDIDQFEKDRKKVLIKMLGRNSVFDREILDFFKRRHVKIDLWLRFLGCIRRPYELILIKLRGNTILRKLYYALKVDILRFGEEQAQFYRYEHMDDNGNLI